MVMRMINEDQDDVVDGGDDVDDVECVVDEVVECRLRSRLVDRRLR